MQEKSGGAVASSSKPYTVEVGCPFEKACQFGDSLFVRATEVVWDRRFETPSANGQERTVNLDSSFFKLFYRFLEEVDFGWTGGKWNTDFESLQRVPRLKAFACWDSWLHSQRKLVVASQAESRVMSARSIRASLSTSF